MSELPKPKFAIGDSIYVPSYADSTEHADCPDCLGAGHWPVKSPAGEDHRVKCPTCTHGGKIKFYKATPLTRRLTIGSVRIDTASGDPVSYMCEETGVGSGSIYYESSCYADEAGAMEAARKMAEAQTLRVRERNKATDELRLLPIESQAVKKARDERWNARYALEQLKREIIELPEKGYLFSTSNASLLREISLHLVEPEDAMREEAA